MPVSVNIGGAITPMAGGSGGGVVPLATNDFPLLINPSPVAPGGVATSASRPTAATAAGAIHCGSSSGGGRVLVTGGGGSHGRSGGPASGHASRESSTGPIRYGNLHECCETRDR